MPAIQEAFDAHQEDGLVVLAVAVDDSAKNVRGFFERHELRFQPLMDDGTASRLYQVFGLPTSVFVASSGQISAIHMGMLTQEDIADYMKAALQD
jgi:peroxiredoxin